MKKTTKSKDKPTLGLCMIVKNEEKVIGRCLESVKDLFDEMVIVDTGSTDKTKEILKKYTDKIYDFEWIYDFSAARNFSFSKSTCDYIMWLDADDVIYKEELKKLLEWKKTLTFKEDAFRMYYNYAQDENDNAKILQQRIRVVKNIHKDYWVGKIHEVIVLDKAVPVLDIVIHHKKQEILDPRRNVDIYQRMEKNNDYFSPRDLFLYATELNGDHQQDKALRKLRELFELKEEYQKNKFYYDMAIMLKFKIYTSRGASVELRKKLLINHLLYFPPTPDVCSEIGNMFNLEQNFHAAVFWFENGLRVAEKTPADNTEYNGFCEYSGLAYAYYYLRDIRKTISYSRKALNIYPSNEMAKRNHQLYLNTYIDVYKGMLNENK